MVSWQLVSEQKFLSAATNSHLDKGLDSYLATAGHLCCHSEATTVYLWLCLFPENKSSPESKFSFRLQDLAAFSRIYFTLYPHTAYRACCEEASQQHEPHNAGF